MTKAEFLDMVAREERDEYGCCTNELVELVAEDLIRKGCTPEVAAPCCCGCKFSFKDCPLNDWNKRHPEFVDDELYQKIQTLRKQLLDRN